MSFQTPWVHRSDRSKMASHTMALDNMDDFFDFDKLEHDTHTHASNSSYQEQSEPLTLPEDVMVMDWAVEKATMSPVPAFPPHDACSSTTFEDAGSPLHRSQWPLFDTPYPPLSTPSGYTDLHSVRRRIGDTATDSAMLDQERLANLTPSSSFIDGEQLGLASALGGEVLIGASSLPQEQSLPEPDYTLPWANSLEASNGAVGASRFRSPVSLRQASTATWKPASAKRKGPQSRIPLEAKQILEDEFAANPYPCSWEMDIIAHQANLDVKKVRNWYNNTRARKKGEDIELANKDTSDHIGHSLEARLSKDSLETLDRHADEAVLPPQPPLAVYLQQSYQEEAVDLSAVQAAIEQGSFDGNDYDDWSDSRRGRTGSVITSVASSDGTAPTTYTVSSSGSRSNISSFGRDRRRGRRRMAWKESPYNNNRQKFNGVNSAGEPQKDLPFFCTFCPRAFKTKYEWIRHEDSVHALRTTWICCDNRNLPLQSCPFCGQAHPDDAHMAAHKYQQCQSKPESQRTFYRRDHFVQHLHHVHFANAKHPSVRVGCQARLMATEGQNFGCKDLAMKWRRFGAPMKRDDPMLHCGFCGKKLKDWSERCEHVAEHLIAREIDRLVWWPERRENHLENLYSNSPFESFRCRYCLKIFTDIKDMNQHSHCKVWSCRFLKSFDDVAADNASPPLCPDFPSAIAHHCHLCGAGYRTPHLEHAHNYHRYRSCNQEFYTSEDAFLQHLHNFHGASQPTLLQGSSIIEQNFMRNKGASFEPIEFNESWQPCLMDLDTTPDINFTVDTSGLITNENKEHSHAKKQSPVRRKPREESQNVIVNATRTQRQRSETVIAKGDHHGPRFFRLRTHVPYFSSRIFYSQDDKSSPLPKDKTTVIEVIPKPHIASLVMSAGLVSMASIRWVIKPEKHSANDLVELTLDGVD